ncbi:large conductance mechanosensitive channel protein MscL [Candidatus Peregrinibacteria bacterium]|nr:large conductance mechanosensitive channel protein MscL [Candidatus Peregrinibacteria bacterium]MBI3816699.1 large conductance mechanosensitive channel protein MscL [Candidatus Peregrinibacteria bacterium]
MLKEFKEFALRGSVIDLAVGVVIGAAFGKIVASLVNDVIMPPLGLFFSDVKIENLYLNLSGKHYANLADAKAAGAATVNYGVFLNAVIEFLIISFAIFILVKQINRLRRPQESTTKACSFCCSSIPAKALRCPQCTSTLKE